MNKHTFEFMVLAEEMAQTDLLRLIVAAHLYNDKTKAISLFEEIEVNISKNRGEVEDEIRTAARSL